MRVSGQRIVVFGDSLSKHGHDSSPEIWDVNQGSNRASSSPGDLLASMLAEQGAEAVRVNARVGRSAWNFFQRENSAQLLASDAHFRPTRVVIMLGTNDVGLGQIPDREAFIKLRDSYAAMGAEIWAIGPFANTSLDQAGVARVVEAMRGVFGRQFIDGREISQIVRPGRDGLHYDQVGARQLAMAIAATLAGRMATNTIWATVGFSLLGVGVAMVGAMAYRRYRGRALGDIGKVSRDEVDELIQSDDPDALDVAQDALLERGDKLTQITKVSGEASLNTKARFELALGHGRKIWWNVTQTGDDRCEASFIAGSQGGLTARVTNRYEGVGKECERVATGDAWAIAKTLKRMPFHETNGWRMNQSAEAVEKMHAALGTEQPPDELLGLRGKRKGPTDEEFETWVKFQDMIRDPDPATMDVAEDFVEQSGHKLSKLARVISNTGGSFTLSPLNPADTPVTAVYWTVEQGTRKPGKSGSKGFNHGPSIEVFFQGKRAIVQGFYPTNGDPEFPTREAASAAGAALAWSVAKAIKPLPANANGGEIYDAVRSALQSHYKSEATSGERADDIEFVWGPKKQLFGASGKDVTFHELIRDEDPGAMQIAEDMALEQGFKIRGVTGGTRHMTIDMNPISEPRGRWKNVASSVYTQPGDAGSGTYPAEERIPREIALTAYNGAQPAVERKVKIKATIEDARKYAAAATWALAKAIKPLPLDTDVTAIVDDITKRLRREKDRKKLLVPKELFGLGRKITRADVIDAVEDNLSGPIEDAINVALDMAEEGKHELADEILFQDANAKPTGLSPGNEMMIEGPTTIVAQCIRPIDAGEGVKQALYHVQSAGPNIGRVEGSPRTGFASAHVIVSASERFTTSRGREHGDPGETAIFPARADSTVIDEEAWPLVLDPESIGDQNSPHAFASRADFRRMFSHIEALKEIGVTHIVPCEGVELFGAKSLGKPQSMLKTIAAESQSADEFARRAEAWASAESSPPSDKTMAKARKGVTIEMIQKARAERQAKTDQRFRKLARGLKGASVGETFKRNNSKTPYTVTEIVRPARTVGTLKIGETVRITHGDEAIEVTDTGGTWIDSQGRKYKRTKG